MGELVLAVELHTEAVQKRVDSLIHEVDILTLVSGLNPKSDGNTAYAPIAKSLGLSTLFYGKYQGASAVYIRANCPEMLGKRILFPQGYNASIPMSIFFGQGKLYVVRNLADEKALFGATVLESDLLPTRFDTSLPVKFTLTPKTKGGATIAANSFTLKREIEALIPDQGRLVFRVSMENIPLDLFVEVNHAELLVMSKEKIYQTIFSHFLIIVIFGVAMVYFLTKKMTKPLSNLVSTMVDVGDGKLESRYEIHRFGFEINFLGERFNEAISSLIHHMSQVETEKLGRVVAEKELELGSEIQKALMGDKVPEVMGMDLASSFLSAKHLGGDFIDVDLQEEQKLFFSIGDVSGKGMGACLYSFSARNILHTLASQGHSLQEIAREANRLFERESGSSGMFVTALFGFMNPISGEFALVRAGHNYPIIYQKGGTVKELRSEGLSLGISVSSNCDIAHGKLEKGESLVLYTDGFVEAHNPQGKLFGNERLWDSLVKHGQLPSAELSRALVDDVESFVGDRAQHDDMALLILKKV